MSAKTQYKDPDGKQYTVPASPITRNIAGHDITLEAGQRYVATRPAYHRRRKVYPVSIRSILSNGTADPDVVIGGLSYEEAHALVNAFNYGPTSFQGRVW